MPALRLLEVTFLDIDTKKFQEARPKCQTVTLQPVEFVHRLCAEAVCERYGIKFS